MGTLSLSCQAWEAKPPLAQALEPCFRRLPKWPPSTRPLESQLPSGQPSGCTCHSGGDRHQLSKAPVPWSGRPGESHHKRQRRAAGRPAVSVRGASGAPPPSPPLVQSARLSTYLTGSHRIFWVYYRQSQGQPLLSNKRHALNSLSLTSNLNSDAGPKCSPSQAPGGAACPLQAGARGLGCSY